MPFPKPRHKYLDFLNFLPTLYCYLLLTTFKDGMYISTSSALCVPYRGKHLCNLQLYLHIRNRKKIALCLKSNVRVGPLLSSPMQATFKSGVARNQNVMVFFLSSLHIYLFLCNEIISVLLLIYGFFSSFNYFLLHVLLNDN